MTEHILIVDDEAGIRSTLGEILADEGYATTLASSVEETRKQLQRGFYDLAILDIWLPDGDGLDLLTEIRRDHAETPVLMISGHASIDTAVKALHQGAYDFLEKPLSLSRVLVTVQNALDHSRLARELRQLEERFDKSEVLVGDSEVMQRLRHDLKTAAQSDSRILITGENGTGKELVARQVHRLSRRRDKPFIEVNCAAIPEELIESELFGHRKGAFTGAVSDRRGRFEQADGGTLFLDEIADMSMKTQAKVLRALEEQRFQRVGGADLVAVDVRVLAATNRDLEAGDQDRALPRRPLLPARGDPDPRAPAARSSRGRAAAGAALPQPLRAGARPAPQAARARGARDAPGLRLARQRARAAQRDGAHDDHGRRRRHHAREPAARHAPPARARDAGRRPRRRPATTSHRSRRRATRSRASSSAASSPSTTAT